MQKSERDFKQCFIYKFNHTGYCKFGQNCTNIHENQMCINLNEYSDKNALKYTLKSVTTTVKLESVYTKMIVHIYTMKVIVTKEIK